MKLEIALTALVMLSGCGRSQQSAETETPGRFAIVHSDDQLARTILLDSATGETWYQVSSGPAGIEDISEWIPMDKTTYMDWSKVDRSSLDAMPLKKTN